MLEVVAITLRRWQAQSQALQPLELRTAAVMGRRRCFIEVSMFVFGSNLAGRHGKGSALLALRKYGAKLGVGVGPQGDCYAIPTKDAKLKRLSLAEIARHVNAFVLYAASHPEIEFTVVKIGCGNAKYTDREIAPMFQQCGSNVKMHPDWVAINYRLRV